MEDCFLFLLKILYMAKHKSAKRKSANSNSQAFSVCYSIPHALLQLSLGAPRVKTPKTLPSKNKAQQTNRNSDIRTHT